MVTNSLDAEYGRSAGAVVNIITKSGTNQIQRSLFEFLRNTDLNAYNWLSLTPTPLRRPLGCEPALTRGFEYNCAANRGQERKTI